MECNVSNCTVKIGDFPDVFPQRTGDWPGQYPYIGDPITPYEPPIKIVPAPVQIWPLGPVTVPNTNPDWWSNIKLMPNPWKVQHLAQGSVFSCDVPGCRPEDVKVQISDRELSVTATRYDGGGTSNFSTPIDVTFYDAREAKAVVAAGVISVTIPYR